MNKYMKERRSPEDIAELGSCMYTVQGDLVCGLPTDGSYDDGFGDADAVRKVRKPLGWADPFDIQTSARLKNQTNLAEEVPEEERPCCRCHCTHIGPCKKPTMGFEHPTAPCVLCSMGLCRDNCSCPPTTPSSSKGSKPNK